MTRHLVPFLLWLGAGVLATYGLITVFEAHVHAETVPTANVVGWRIVAFYNPPRLDRAFAEHTTIYFDRVDCEHAIASGQYEIKGASLRCLPVRDWRVK